MRKKLVALSMAVLMLAVAVVGGTLAYFTDAETADNVFTTGNVDINLEETFVQDSKIVPGDSNTNTVQKEVRVENVGSEDAFVRVHIAIPADLVDQEINSYNDILHMNFSAASAADGKWSWHPTYSEGNGWTDNGLENNNTYNATIGNKDYTVWVVTYRTALKTGETTENAISQVYMDKYTEATANENGTVTYTKPFFTDRQGGTVDPNKTMSYTTDGSFEIKVFAEAGQAAGFANAYDALNTQFGNPKATGYVAPWNQQ